MVPAMRNLIITLLLMSAPSASADLSGPWLEDTGGADTGAISSTSPAEGSRFGRTPEALCSQHVLRNGMQLPDQPELYVVRNPSEAWGTPEMVEAVVQAAEDVAWLLPGADPIIVGDISRRRGGQLAPHKTHRSGIDADISLFVRSGEREHISSFRAVTPYNLDYEANWVFWRGLLETGLVDRILLDQRLIDAMRRWTVAEGQLSAQEAAEIFPPRGAPGIWTRTGVFVHAAGHQDHIHLRVLCGDEVPSSGDGEQR